MKRKIKTLGAAVIAVLAVGAFGAQGAAGHEFHTETSATDLTGEGTGVFTIQGFSFTCSNARFAGTQTGSTADHMRLHPTYNNTENTCEASLGKMTIHTEGCDYTFDSDTDANGHAAVEVVCEPGKEITLTSAGCIIHIPAQKPTGGVSFHNESLTNDLRMTWTMTGLTATGTHSFGCTIAGKVGHLTNGTYTETSTLRGYKDTSAHNPVDQIGIWVE